MGWQFGGNLQPVRMICEFDWRECPWALINYMWSEIVTDVVECLTNEWMMWRVIAMLFVCTLLIHTIYAKTRLIDETSTNRENLNVVGCKVQDLELRVNILTYKMQYGTWPLPRQIRGTGVEGGLRNVRLTLTDPSDRNAWLKHMLLSPTENVPYLPYEKIGPRSVRCLTKLINLETKYMSSKFAGDQSPGSKTSCSTSEKSSRCEKPSEVNFNVEDTMKKCPRSDNILTKNMESLDLTRKRPSDCWSETQVLKYREYPRTWTKRCRETSTRSAWEIKNSPVKKTPEERVSTTQETLHSVKEKLENLHSVLRIYGEPMYSVTKESRSSNKQLAESILRDLTNLVDNPEGENRREASAKQLISSTSDFEECRSEQDFSSFDVNFEENKNSLKIVERESPIEKIEETSLNPEEPIKIMGDQSVGDKEAKKIQPPSENPRIQEKSKADEKSEDSPSGISSIADYSSDNDEKTNVALLREALRIKSLLMTRIEDESSEKIREQSEEEDDDDEEEAKAEQRVWQKVKGSFQPKFLDIISEEQSASSSNEKTCRKVEEARVENFATEKNNAEIENSKTELASGSSEYLSLKNSDEINSKTATNGESSKDNNDSNVTEKNYSNFLNSSVENIRQYIEVFSQLQNDAIMEAKRAIDDEKLSPSVDNFWDDKKDGKTIFSPREITSVDSLTRFVNKIGTTMSEELPRKLSEPAIIRLVDLEVEKSENESVESSDFLLDYRLKRRPGTISLGSKILLSSDENNSIEATDTLAKELEDFEARDDSWRKLGRNFSEESCNDSSDDKNASLTNLMVFEDEIDSKFDDKSRLMDSPLTGRTVIRGSASFSSNVEISLKNSEESVGDGISMNSRDKSEAVEARLVEIDETNDKAERIVEEKSSIYFSDEAAFFELDERASDDKSLELPGVSEEACEFQDFSSLRDEPKVGEKNNSCDETKGKNARGNYYDEPEARVDWEKNLGTMSDEPKVGENIEEESKSAKVQLENIHKRPTSGETIVMNSPRSKTGYDCTESPNVSSDPSAIYMDAESRELLKSSATSFRHDKIFLSNASIKSARASSSSSFQQNNVCSAAKRGSSLNNSSSEKSRKIPKASMSREKEKDVTKRKSHFHLSGSKDLESSNIERFNFNSSTDIRERRRSRSYATPRKTENSPRNFEANEKVGKNRNNERSDKNSPRKIVDSKETRRIGRARKNDDFNVENRKSGCVNESVSSKTSLPKTSILTESAKSRENKNQDFPRARDGAEVATNSQSTIREDSTNNWPDFKCEESSPKIRSDEKLANSGALKNSSKSCIPVLRRRLEAVRQSSHEKRAKSPARCPLTISTTTAWSRENHSSSAKSSIVEKIPLEGSLENTIEKMDENRGENRTVIYVNIVTEEEKKSTTRIVDPKKFLEYLKDRDLKIQSIEDRRINVEKLDTSSPKIFTVVSSAVDENIDDPSVLNSRPDHSSLRVEQREIEVSAKPSVIDTSTSISDLPFTNSRISANGKFEIFQVPKELTKDEYIVLLEALNQDPNLHQLREMHKLCNKLGLGFRE